MTPSEHAALSAELARALGWEVNRVPNGGVFVFDPASQQGGVTCFDYRDPTVCLPLIEWLGKEQRIFFWGCAPTAYLQERWSSNRGDIGDTLPEAVARAVIAVKKGKT